MTNSKTIKSLFTVFFFLIAIQANSQDLRFGVKGGLNYSSNYVLYTGETVNLDYKTDFNAGVYFSVPLSDRFNLQSDLLFSRKGNTSDNVRYERERLELSYVSIPILLRWQIPGNFDIAGGIENSFLINATSINETGTRDVNNFYDNQFDFGLVAGIGYYISEKLHVEARYVQGLRTVIKDLHIGDFRGMIAPEKGKFKNRVFQFSLHYNFLPKR